MSDAMDLGARINRQIAAHQAEAELLNTSGKCSVVEHRWRSACRGSPVPACFGSTSLAPLERETCSGTHEGLVYFIEAVGSGRVKIGWTLARSVEGRRYSLQTSSPFPLRVLGWMRGSLKTEQRLHAQFDANRVMPNAEWFFLTDELARTIARSCPWRGTEAA